MPILLSDLRRLPEVLSSALSNGYMSSADFTKLAGIESGATANSSDATLLNRANHTGTQSVSTLSDLSAASVGLDSLVNVDNTDASTLTSGTINIDRLPKTAVAFLLVVADQTARFTLTITDVQNGDTVKQTDTDTLYYVVDDTNLGNAAGYETYKATIDWSTITSLPANLTDIASITKTDDDIIQVKGGVYTNRTISQYKTDLAINNVDNTSDADKPVSTAQSTAIGLKLDATHAGTGDAAHSIVTSSVNGFMSSTDFDKLAGVASGATANSTDATLLDRANHTGTQSVSTLSDLSATSVGLGSLVNVDNTDASTLTSGTINIDRLPKAAVALLKIVADQTARFALTITDVQNGDTVKQTDTNTLYIVKDDTNLGNAAGYETYKATIDWSVITSLPANLTDIASIAKTNDDIIQVKGGVYTNRTVAQYKEDLALNSVDNTSDVDKPVSTAQATAIGLKLDAAHAGTGDAAHSAATGSANGFMSSTDFDKLAGIASGATANSSDATLLNRANHTGTQSASTTLTGNLPDANLTDLNQFSFKGRKTTGVGSVEEFTLRDILSIDTQQYRSFTDFINTSSCGYNQTVAGIGASVSNIASNNTGVVGVVQLSTGTMTTGVACLQETESAAGFVASGGEIVWMAKIYIPTLSDATQRFTLRLGFGDTTTLTDETDGIYFESLDSISVNWQCCTASNSTRTKTASTTAVAAAAWTVLKIVVNSDGTSAEFFVNNVSIGTNTTNIPIAIGREFFSKLIIIKSVGTTARTILVDKVYTHKLTTIDTAWSI